MVLVLVPMIVVVIMARLGGPRFCVSAHERLSLSSLYSAASLAADLGGRSATSAR
jgi:hypothetical protein